MESMNPNSGEAPKFELPANPPGGYETDGQAKSPEKAPAQENAVGKRAPVASPPISPQSDMPVAGPITVPATYQTSKPSDDTSSGLTAAEIDRIEKEWIDKAKSIVAKTSDDPFEQNSEMSKVKADYIKKRFNKTIPTDDTVKA